MLTVVAAPMSPAATEQQPTAPPPSSYKDQVLTEFFRRTSGWVAGDGASSIPLSDGRVLWLFGDSHIDDYDADAGTIPCLFQVRNAAMVHHKNDLRHSQTLLSHKPDNRSLFQHPADNRLWFWPVSGFQHGDTIYIYLTLLQKAGDGGPLGFKAIGHYWGKMKFPELEVAAYVALPASNGIDFGCGFVIEGRYIYAFGNKQDFLESGVYVARFKIREPHRDWAYWDGKSWNANVTNAVVIGRGASTSVNVCKVKDKYLLTTSQFSVGCDQGKEIYVSTSSSPTGPFSPRKKIFTLDDTVQGHFPFFYLPVAHPEFINDKNELLVTYSINGYEPCFPSCVNGRAIPDHYRPKAIRIPWKLIEPAL